MEKAHLLKRAYVRIVFSGHDLAHGVIRHIEG